MAARKTVKARRGRGEGSVHERADGRWAGAVSAGFDRDGKRVRKWVYADTKAEALARIEIVRRELVRRGSIVLDDEKLTLADFLDMWLDDLKKPNIRTNTYHGYESVLRLHVRPHIGATKLRKITPVVLQRLYVQLEQAKVGARTRESVHVTLRAAMHRAVRLNMIESNPVDHLDRPRKKTKETRALSLDEVGRFMEAAAGDAQRNLYLLIIMTGLRPGEAVALRWGDVNLKEGTLAIRRSVEYAGGKIAVDDAKTHGSRRRIDLPDMAVQVLTEQREVVRAISVAREAYIFPDVDGGPYHFWSRRTAFGKIIKSAKLGAFTLYGLRHTFATLALAAGIPLKVVSEQLGHASIKITADTYQHVLPSLQKTSAKQLNGIFEQMPILTTSLRP